jgi:hypothetical protein
MKKANRSKGLGYSTNEVTRDLNGAARNKFRTTIAINEAWRKAKEEDPQLEFRKSFVEFKREYYRKFQKSLGRARK